MYIYIYTSIHIHVTHRTVESTPRSVALKTPLIGRALDFGALP